MGLFDSLKKMTEDLGKEIEKGVNSEGFKDFKNAVENAAKDASNGVNPFAAEHKTKEIPAEYSEFPTFSSNPDELRTTETDKYIRCSMEFYHATEQEVAEYVSKINSLGYVKGSRVRYDKGNTYIIVDTDNGGLNLVYHIKR